MRWLASAVCLLALIIAALPDLGAQDKKDAPKADKKDGDKKDADKKDADKKDADKTDAKKTDEKKDAKKEPEDKVVYGQTLTAKLKRMDANSARDFTIEVAQVDPVKVNMLNLWQMNEMARIMRTDPRQRGAQMLLYQVNLARKNTEIYSYKDMDLRAADNCKVRALSPPIEFDDKGRQKVYTNKELTALKGNSKLPGYPADFDRLSAGQTVTVYFSKNKDLPKKDAAAPKKKNADDDDPARPEAVMIVVVKEAPMR
jgi:hypothetical protein